MTGTLDFMTSVCSSMLPYIVTVVFIVLLTLYCIKKDAAPIFEVHKQPGKWYYFKYFVFRTILYLRKWKSKHSRNYKNDQNYGFGIFQDVEKFECAQKLSSLPQAFDAVFFMAVTQDGYYVVAGCERRKHNIVNGLFYVVVPGIGLLHSFKLPDTVLFGTEDNTFGAEGILIKAIEPMKKWKVSYTGTMWLHEDPSYQVNVEFSGEWQSTLPSVNFDSDLDPGILAQSIALETWTRNYFINLKNAHQIHYEQMGSMNATLILNEKVHILNDMASFRDHSTGAERNWDLMHRYAFHMFFLEDSTKAAISVVCQPSSNSVLYLGYVCTPQGQIYPLEWCDFLLYQHGENGKPPKDYAFRFQAGYKMFTAQVNVEYEGVHYVGWKWEAKMHERFLKCTINGIKGRGISEFHYRSKKGRPHSVSYEDPKWFEDTVKEFYAARK